MVETAQAEELFDEDEEQPPEQTETQDQIIARQAQQIAAWETKWRRCWDRLNAEAVQRGWCSDYDYIAAEVGGIPRDAELTTVITATVVTELTRQQVLSTLGPAHVRSLLEPLPQARWETQLSFTLTAPRSACHITLDEDWEQRARRWLERQNVRYSDLVVTTVRCHNCS